MTLMNDPVKKRPTNTHLLATLTMLLIFSVNTMAQVHRIGGGLAFSTGAEFNYGETGNPGFTLKTWFAINRMDLRSTNLVLF